MLNADNFLRVPCSKITARAELNALLPGLFDIPKHLLNICFGKWVWGILFDHFSGSVHMVIYDRTRRADHRYKNNDEKLTVLALLSTFRKPLAVHPTRLSISTHFLSIANFRQPLTGISTYPRSSKHRTLTTQKGAGRVPSAHQRSYAPPSSPSNYHRRPNRRPFFAPWYERWSSINLCIRDLT